MTVSILQGDDFPKFTFRNNNLGPIINLIKDQNVVVLHAKGACRIFHNNPSVLTDKPDALKNVKVIYLDCNNHPGLITENNGFEFERFIKKAIDGVSEMGNTNLSSAIIEQKGDFDRTYKKLV